MIHKPCLLPCLLIVNRIGISWFTIEAIVIRLSLGGLLLMRPESILHLLWA